MSIHGSPKRLRGRRPPSTPEAREQQLSSMAMDLAERQLEDGSASAQVITHFLKLASSREQLEQTRLQQENTLLAVKAENMMSAKRVEELYESALNAMRTYSGQDEPRFDDDDY